MTVQVREKEMIRKVDVQGNYSLSAGKVRELLILKEGDVMRYDLVDQMRWQNLRRTLPFSGFLSEDRHHLIKRRTKHHHNVTLTVMIEAGPALVIKEVKITRYGPCRCERSQSICRRYLRSDQDQKRAAENKGAI